MSDKTASAHQAMVGRVEEIKLFGERLQTLQMSAKQRRFMHFYGTGGIGKTVLLEACRTLCQKRGIASATITFESASLRDLAPGDAVAAMLLQIAEQLKQANSALHRLLADRTERLTVADAEGPVALALAQSAFVDRLAQGLVELATAEPVVLFIDMVEAASPELRWATELGLVARMAAAPRGMVVSASRADLPATWSQERCDLFDKFHLQPLPAGDMGALCDVAELGPGVASRLCQSAVLSKLIRDVGRGNPKATALAAQFVNGLLKEHEDIAVHGLSPQQQCDLYTHMYVAFLRGWAYYLIEPGSWPSRAYKKTVPARCVEPGFLEALFTELGVERQSAAETAQQAAKTFEELGLAYWNPSGLYQLDPLPRQLEAKYLECVDKAALRQATAAIVRVYKARILEYEPSPTISQDILEYLFHVHALDRLDGKPEPAIASEIVSEIERCLAVNPSPQVVDTLWRAMREDDELAEVFGLSLTAQALATVEQHSPRQATIRAESAEQERNALIRNVRTANCVLFLGPGLTLEANYLDTYAALAQDLAQESGYQGEPTDLLDVAEHYAAIHGADKLARVAAQYVKKHLRPDATSLDGIVSLPLRVIATTAVDSALEEAYGRARRPVERVLFPAAGVGTTRGADLLVMLNGTVGQRNSLRLTRRQQAELRSHLMREDDAIVAMLRRGQALFLGFSLRDPMLYALHTLVRGAAGLAAGRSVVVTEESWPHLREAWQAELAILQEPAASLLQELQERYQDYLDATMKIWSGTKVLEEASAGRSLTNKRMSGIILPEHSSLEGQNLSGCELYGAMLKRVTLNQCTLLGVDLGGANLEGAFLKGCQAEGVVLTQADLTGAEMENAHLTHAEMTGATMDNTKISGAQFDQSESSLVDFTGAEGTGPSFADANLTQARFTDTKLHTPVFRDSLLWDSDFSGAKLPNADFGLANLTNAKFKGATLTGARFYFADLRGADFTGADVCGADFTQALLGGAQLSAALNVLEANFDRALLGTAELPEELRQRLREQAGADTAAGPVAPELKAVTAGEYLLILGPGLSMGHDYMDRYEEFARELAKECGWEGGEVNLADVAQCYSARRGRAPLLLEVKGWIEGNQHPDEASLDLATSLPFDVIINTALDSQLARAYQKAHRPSTLMPALSARTRKEPGKDLIVSLCGGVDWTNAPLTITRQDLLEMEARLARPDNPLAPYLRDRVLLFLGFDLRDPLLYTLHALLRQHLGGSDCRAYVAQDTETSPLATAWAQSGLLSCTSRELLEEFQGRWLQSSNTQNLRILDKDELLHHLDTALPLAGRRLLGVELDPGFDLRKARDMTRCRLTSAHLAKVVLSKVTLNGADLSRADLTEAQLDGCELLGARLSGVKAQQANLTKADLGQAILPAAELQHATLDGVRLVEAEMFGALLNDAQGKDADFTRAKLPKANLSDAKLPGAVFRDCYATDAVFQRATLTKAVFQMANLTGAHFEGAHLERATFHSANLSRADFTKANVAGANFSLARLEDADFSGARGVDSATFTGADWQHARLPEKLRRRLEQSKAASGDERR